MDPAGAVLSFALVAGLLAITPGLDTALVLRAAVAGGRRAGYAAGLGVCAGALAWGAAAAVGVSALVTTSRGGFTALRVAGAAYLLWIGGRLLLRAWGERAAPDEGDESAADRSPSNRSAFGRGLLTNLLNPKVGAFYVAVLPQFLPVGASPLGFGLLLASVHALESLLWFTVVILGAQALRGILRRPAARRAVDGATGTVLVGFGLRLGLSGSG
jgi:threonine/homoserine/homoserine lactone efflux protein